MATITVSSFLVENWQDSTVTTLRIFCDSGFTTSGTQYVPQSGPSDTVAYKSLTCTYDSAAKTLLIPSFTIDSTTDGLDITTARFSAYFFDTSGTLVRPFAGFTSFAVPATPTTTTWVAIRIYNQGSPQAPNETYYTRAQVDSIISAQIAGFATDDEVAAAAGIRASDYASLNAAVSAIGSSNRTLIISSTLTLSTSLTVPSNITLMFLGNGLINFSGSSVLTINGPMIAPERQIFGTSGGTVSFGNRVPALYPQWWGALADSSTDDTVAVQAALTAGQGTSTKRVVFPRGTYLVSSTLTITNTRGLKIEGLGAGNGGTSFAWGGNATDAMWKITNSQYCVFSDFIIQANSPSFPLALGLWMYTTVSLPRTFVSRFNTFRNVDIISGLNYLTDGYKIGGTTAQDVLDANNDFHHFDHCAVLNFTGTAWKLENSQIFGVLFNQCLVSGIGYGQSAVTTSTGTSSQGGAFTWIGGGLGGLQDYTFIVGTPSQQGIRIHGADIENAESVYGGILKVLGPTAASGPVELDGVSYRTGSTNPASPINVINIEGPGPVRVVNCNIGNQNGVDLRFRWNPGGGTDDRSYAVENTRIQTSFTTLATIFNGPLPTTIKDMIVTNGSGTTIVSGSQQMLTVQDPGIMGLVVRAASAQTADLLEFQNTSGTMQSAFDKNGDLNLAVAGRGIYIKEGSNARMGVATLVAGAVTVSNTSVTANTRIFLTKQDTANTATVRVSARVANTSFTITSADGADTSNVAWILFEPS